MLSFGSLTKPRTSIATLNAVAISSTLNGVRSIRRVPRPSAV